MRTEQGGGRDEEGAEQGEEMHAALLNSSFFFLPLPFNPLCQVFFHSGASLCKFLFVALPSSLFFKEMSAFVLINMSLTADYSSVSLGHWTEKSKPEYWPTAFAPKSVPDTEEGATAGFKLRHTCPDAWPGVWGFCYAKTNRNSFVSQVVFF